MKTQDVIMRVALPSVGIVILYFGFLSSAGSSLSSTAPTDLSINQDPSPAAPPPLAFTGNGDTDPGRWYKKETFYSGIIIRPLPRTISFSWVRVSGAGNTLYYKEKESTWFWPQTAEWISETVLLVAGKSTRDGASVLQQWKYEDDPAKPQVISSYDPATGQTTHQWHVPNRLSVQQEPIDPNLPPIHWIKESPGASGHVFVFVEGGDVFDLELGSGVYSLAASPLLGAPLHVPAMGFPALCGGYGLEHLTDGYVYSVSSDLHNLDDSVEFVYLIDEDKDGVLDRWETIQTLQAAGDINRYNDDDNALWFW